jgi:hypothetical protein
MNMLSANSTLYQADQTQDDHQLITDTETNQIFQISTVKLMATGIIH